MLETTANITTTSALPPFQGWLFRKALHLTRNFTNPVSPHPFHSKVSVSRHYHCPRLRFDMFNSWLTVTSPLKSQLWSPGWPHTTTLHLTPGPSPRCSYLEERTLSSCSCLKGHAVGGELLTAFKCVHSISLIPRCTFFHISLSLKPWCVLQLMIHKVISSIFFPVLNTSPPNSGVLDLMKMQWCFSSRKLRAHVSYYFSLNSPWKKERL